MSRSGWCEIVGGPRSVVIYWLFGGVGWGFSLLFDCSLSQRRYVKKSILPTRDFEGLFHNASSRGWEEDMRLDRVGSGFIEPGVLEALGFTALS